MRSSSLEVALATVSRPRLRCSEPRVGRGVGTSAFCGAMGVRPGRRTTRDSSSPAGLIAAAGALDTGCNLRGADGAGAGSPPARRRRASSSDWRLKVASCARRSSSSRFRASAASRSARSRASRSRRASASASCRRRSSSSCARASRSALARASRCSAVRVGSTTPVFGGGGAVGFAGAAGAGLAEATERVGFAGAPAPCGAATGAVSPGPRTRRFTFSTRTALLRPCEKLCRTVPCSTGRFRCRVAFGVAPTVLSLLFVSFMPIPIRLALQPIRPACQTPRRRWPGAPQLCHQARRPFRSRDKDANAPPSRGRQNSPLQI